MSAEDRRLVKMRFIGKPNGVYMKGAPSNYVQNQIYTVPFRFSRFKYWELVEPVAEIKAPEPKKEDSVFNEDVFIPPEEKLTSSAQVGDLTLSTPEPQIEDKIEASPIIEAKVETPPAVEAMPEIEDEDDTLPPEIRAEMEAMGPEWTGEPPKPKRRIKKNQ